MILLLLAMLAMAASDFLDTLNTIAESRDRPLFAGLTAAGSKTLEMGVAVVGADTLVTHGLSATVVYGVAVFVTTLIATDRAEVFGAKHVKAEG